MRSLLSTRSYLFGSLALLASACIPGIPLPPLDLNGIGGEPTETNPPTTTELSEARSLVLLAMDASQSAHAALALLGLLPVYECGESRASFVGALVPQLQAQLACAQVSTSAQAGADSITLSFPPEGCDIGAHTLSGALVFTYSGGADRLDLVLDAQGVTIDVEAVQVTGGYSACGDQESYFVSARGSLPGQANATYDLDASVTIQPGFPVFGSPTLIFDGTGALTTTAGTHQLSLDHVEYKPGDIAPQRGVIAFTTASGHNIVATFATTSPFTQSVNIVINDRDLVTIPLLSL